MEDRILRCGYWENRLQWKLKAQDEEEEEE
jgi:hypothetical protein